MFPRNPTELKKRAKESRNIKGCFYQDFFHLSNNFPKRHVKRQMADIFIARIIMQL